MENKKSWAEQEEEMAKMEDHGIFFLLFNFVILRMLPKSILC